MESNKQDITAVLRAIGAGQEGAMDELFQVTYDKLRTLADVQRRRWEGDDTLTPTALVHEAYLRLSRQELPKWQDRGHFFAIAARAMRQILINHAERNRAKKRGGDAEIVPEHETTVPEETRVEELLALDQALTRLEAVNERQARVVECRFFAGLSIDETAEALQVSAATVKREWALARTRLHRELRRSGTAV